MSRVKVLAGVGAVALAMSGCSTSEPTQIPSSDETYRQEFFGEPMAKRDAAPAVAWETNMGDEATAVPVSMSVTALWTPHLIQVWDSATGEKVFEATPADMGGTALTDVQAWEKAGLVGVTVFDAEAGTSVVTVLDDSTWDEKFSQPVDRVSLEVSNDGDCFLTAPTPFKTVAIDALAECGSTDVAWSLEVDLSDILETDLRFTRHDDLMFIGEARAAGDIAVVSADTGEQAIAAPFNTPLFPTVFPMSDRVYIVEQSYPDLTLAAYTYAGEKIVETDMPQYMAPIVLGDDLYFEWTAEKRSKMVKLDPATLESAWAEPMDIPGQFSFSDPVTAGAYFARSEASVSRLPSAYVVQAEVGSDPLNSVHELVVVDPQTRQVRHTSAEAAGTTTTTGLVPGDDQIIGVADKSADGAVDMWAYDVTSGEITWTETFENRERTEVWNVLSVPLTGTYVGYW